MKNDLTAKRLQQALTLAGIRAQELSELSGVSKASISQYINGTHAPSNISAGKMSGPLNVNPVWLMGFDVPMVVRDKEGAAPAATVSPDESALLKDYHQLNDLGKARARDAVSDLTQIPKYRNAEAVQISRQENKDNSIVPITPLSDPLAVNAAHAMDPTPEERRHADNIMMDDEEWN